MHDKMDGTREKQPSDSCNDSYLQTDFIKNNLNRRM